MSAVLYADAKDFGGVYEIIKKMQQANPSSIFDGLIDHLERAGLSDAETVG